MRYLYERKGGCVWRVSPDGSIHFRWEGDQLGWVTAVSRIGEFLDKDGNLQPGISEYKTDPFDS